MQRSLNLHPLFQPLFRKISQPPGQDQQKGGVCRLPPYSSRIVNPEPQSSSIPYLFTIVRPVTVGEKSKNMVFRLLENAFVSQKIESKHFYSCKILPQVQSSPPGKGKLLVSPRQHSFENLFTQQKGVCPTAERVAIWVYNIMFMGFSSFVIVRFFSISTNDW